MYLSKHPFIEQLKAVKRNKRYFYVYGAGIYGRSAVKLLKKYNVPIDAVLVTELSQSPNDVLGITVKSALDVEDYQNSIVMIAIAEEQANKEIAEFLLNNRVEDIIKYEDTPFFVK